MEASYGNGVNLDRSAPTGTLASMRRTSLATPAEAAPTLSHGNVCFDTS